MAGCAEEKHGAYTVHLKKRFSDKRTTEGRKLKAALNGIIKDLGGKDKLNQAQKLILDAIKPKLVIIWQLTRYIDEHPSDIVDRETGDVIPVLRSTLSTFAESMRRDLEALYLMKRGLRHSDYEKAIKSMQGKG